MFPIVSSISSNLFKLSMSIPARSVRTDDANACPNMAGRLAKTGMDLTLSLIFTLNSSGVLEFLHLFGKNI